MAAPVYVPEVGDTVKLVSGGPTMTVVKVVPAVPAVPPSTVATPITAHCAWFDAQDNVNLLSTAAFLPAALTLIALAPVFVPPAPPTPAPTKKNGNT